MRSEPVQIPVPPLKPLKHRNICRLKSKTNQPGGHTRSNRVGWDISSHDRSGCDDGAVADRYSIHDYRAFANPHIIANRDAVEIFIAARFDKGNARLAFRRIESRVG